MASFNGIPDFGGLPIDVSIYAQNPQVLQRWVDLMTQAPSLVQRAVSTVAGSLAVQIQNELRQAPGSARYPIQWTSETQRRFVMRILRLANNLPYQRRGIINNGWSVEAPVGGSMGVELSIANPVKEAVYVYGQADDSSWQQGFHANTGWYTLAPRMAQYEYQLETETAKEISSLALAFGGELLTTSVFGPYYALLGNTRKLLGTQNAQQPADDERIFYYIAEASQLVEDFCGQNFDERWLTYGFYGEVGLNNATLSLQNRPLLSLNSVTNGDGTIISNTNITILPIGSLYPKYDVRLNPGNFWRSKPGIPNVFPFSPLLDYSYAQDAIQIYGSWGFHRRYPRAYQPTNLTLATSLDAVTETLTLSGPMNAGRYGLVDVGAVLLVDTEQIAIVGPFGDTARASTVVSVLRGYNNTTAAGHNSAAPISVWIPEPTVTQAVSLAAAAQYARELNPTDDQVTLANYGTFSVQRNALPSKVKNMLGAPLYNFVWGMQA